MGLLPAALLYEPDPADDAEGENEDGVDDRVAVKANQGVGKSLSCD